MPFVIQYFKDDQQVGKTPWPPLLEKAIEVVQDGLIRYHADSYRIIDDTTGAEVASGSRKKA